MNDLTTPPSNPDPAPPPPPAPATPRRTWASKLMIAVGILLGILGLGFLGTANDPPASAVANTPPDTLSMVLGMELWMGIGMIAVALYLVLVGMARLIRGQ